LIFTPQLHRVCAQWRYMCLL